MKYNVTETYTVHASSAAAARDAILTGAEGIRFHRDYRLKVESAEESKEREVVPFEECKN